MVASLDQPAALILHGSSSIALILQPVTNLQPVTHTLTTRFQPVAPAPALLHCPHPCIACPLESLAGLYWSPAGIARTDPARRLAHTCLQARRLARLYACTLLRSHTRRLARSLALACSHARTCLLAPPRLALARRLAGLCACTLARSYARTHARLLARLLALACSHAHTHSLARLYARTLALARLHLPGSPSLAGLQARTLVRLQARTLARLHLLARTLALACSHLLACSLALPCLDDWTPLLKGLHPLAQMLARP
ncbi:hypothetical protein PCASD_24173, partial [Puccinia coronata f. sp. avenae]